MKSVFVEEKTLDSMWFRLLYELHKHGRKNHIDAGSYAGANRLEFDFVAGTIEFPTTRPLAPVVPEGVPVPTTDDEILHYFENYIMDGENLAENEHYRYATFINGGKYTLPKAEPILKNVGDLCGDFKWESGLEMVVPSQVEWCINHYKEKGYGNNHCAITVSYPESNFAYDMPYETEADRQTSPCLRIVDTSIKDGKLCFAVVFRSWDLFSGFPENMGGLTMLMEYMANELEVKVGALSFSCLKLHCYDFQIEAMKARLNL